MTAVLKITMLDVISWFAHGNANVPSFIHLSWSQIKSLIVYFADFEGIYE